jgi:vitamin B12 transporter
MKEDTTWGSMTTTDLWKHYFLKETDWGTKGQLVWGDRRFNLTTGLEYEHNQMSSHETVQVDPAEQNDKNFNRYGIYANGTLSFGALTILPGIRYDRVDDEHNELSYTLGATYRLTEKSVFRTYFAQGYSRAMAVLNNTPPQKGWTVQTGIETGDIPYLWFKGTLFYNDTWNMPNLTGVTEGIANLYNTSQIRQGFEIEVRTIPLYGFSLATGYTLTDLRDKDTRTRVEQVPGDLLKLAVTYDNPAWGLHGVLNGNYVWWNSPPGFRAEDRTFLWNLHLTQKLLPTEELSPELFLTVYNLFNGAQYSDYHYPNAGRWLEGGVRFRF